MDIGKPLRESQEEGEGPILSRRKTMYPPGGSLLYAYAKTAGERNAKTARGKRRHSAPCIQEGGKQLEPGKREVSKRIK